MQQGGSSSLVARRLALLSFAVFLSGPAALEAQSWQEAIQAGDRAMAGADYVRAAAEFEAALQQAEGFNANDPRRAETLVRLARVYRAQGDFAKPEGFYENAIAIAEKAFGQETPEYARYLNEIGRYFHTRRKYPRAHEYYRTAFGVRVRTLGREHADVAESLSNLAVLYENESRFDKAEVYYRYALDIREKVLGPDHPLSIATLEHFARLLHKMNRGAEAEPMRERAQAYRTERIREMGGQTSATAGEIYEPSAAGVLPPTLAERAEPYYTEEARIARHEGEVILMADISAQGAAGNFRLVRSLGLGLDERAVEAVRTWRFEPARINKKKVAFRAILEISFRVL